LKKKALSLVMALILMSSGRSPYFIVSGSKGIGLSPPLAPPYLSAAMISLNNSEHSPSASYSVNF
jgi:hypothetical protein